MVISFKKFFSLHHVFEKVLPPRFTFLKTDSILPHPKLPLVRDGVFYMLFLGKYLHKKMTICKKMNLPNNKKGRILY